MNQSFNSWLRLPAPVYIYRVSFKNGTIRLWRCPLNISYISQQCEIYFKKWSLAKFATWIIYIYISEQIFVYNIWCILIEVNIQLSSWENSAMKMYFLKVLLKTNSVRQTCSINHTLAAKEKPPSAGNTIKMFLKLSFELGSKWNASEAFASKLREDQIKSWNYTIKTCEMLLDPILLNSSALIA